MSISLASCGRILGWASSGLLAAALVLLIWGQRAPGGALVIAGLAALAFHCPYNARLKPYAFTFWVLVFVAASMIYPGAFGVWFGQDLKILIVPLIQVITFGMGTTLSVADFARVFVIPWPVFIGIVLHFIIMPTVGFTIASTFGFEPEVAAGVILIGSVSSGVASNVITYLAGGNVALSVTITACSTLMSPVMTPLAMKMLAGRLVPIHFMAMMLEILNMIIVPIFSGLVANKILYGSSPVFKKAGSLGLIAVGSLAAAVGVLLVAPSHWGSLAIIRNGCVIGFSLIGVVALAKLIISVWLQGPGNWMDRALPLVSMVGICLIIAVITARSREKLLTVGLALIGAAMLHNLAGYLLGYWLARLARLSEVDSRTVAIEVGMQNGGMASGLAMSVLKSADAALAPAIFGPWMNISGSILASWWRRNPAVPRSPSASTP